jgi:hypothetical protein
MRSFSVEETISKDSVASEGNVFNILAGTVSRTLTGALSALTSLATITLKALTLSNVTVTRPRLVVVFVMHNTLMLIVPNACVLMELMSLINVTIC